ncbi:two-component regulator propeller domain-containing protein [Zunongwangia sp.]|uniref:hybrid sensor histidine kinase/response regulator transcription factor n=1 Tax=Zunongwangia sp. TaxID=1965325 RepID=UPI003AA9B7D8
MRSISLKIFLLLFLAYTANSFSQTSQFNEIDIRFSHIGVADGLSPGAVNCIFKSNDGFLWIGTTSGLNRYDGYSFKTINPKPSDTLAYQSRDYRQIFEDPIGNIWAETQQGINIFNRDTQSFSSNQTKVIKALGLPEGTVTSIKKDKNDDYWFIYADARIVKYNKKNIDVSSVIKELSIQQDTEIADITEDKKGDFWIIFKNGFLVTVNGKTLQISAKYNNLKEHNDSESRAYRLVIDKLGNIWIHSYGRYGVYHFNVAKELLQNFSEKTSKPKISNDLVSELVTDSKGNIWVGTDHGGITIIDPEDFTVQYLENNPEIENSLSHNTITAMYKDAEGILWIGTFKNGVDYYHPNIIRFPLYKKLVSDPNSLPFNDVNVFEEDKNGNLYLGTNGGGLIYLNRKTGKYTQYLHNPDNPKSISSNVIVSLLVDDKNQLWIGTYLGGLNKLTADGFITYTHNPASPNSIAGNNIWELYEDSSGYIWIGTLQGGLDQFDPEKEIFYNSNKDGGKFIIHNSYISSITEDSRENLWIGGLNGIDVINLKTGKSTHFTHILGKENSLEDNFIFSIYSDNDNHIWVGTQKGLELYNPKEQSFYHYKLKDGLPGEKIIGIVEDSQNDIWLTSSNGIAQFSKDSINKSGKIIPNFKIYNDLDGLQGNIFNENSIFKTSRGEILVGGLHGYNIFNPEEFEVNTKLPKVVFTNFYLFNNTILPNQEINGRKLLKKPLYKTSEISLKYEENIFSIGFAALDYFQPSKNKYKYKLEGFDANWQMVNSDQREVTYTNLDPGSYIFKVKASNNDNFWNTEATTLKIEVLPPFYKTTYAYIFYVLIIAGILYVGRERIIDKQRKSFQIAQEKREASYLHQMDLMRIRFFTNISHEFKTPLSFILSPLEQLKQRELQPQVQEQIAIINKNAQKLLNLINQILDLGNIKNDMLLSSSRGNVIHFIEEIADSFQELAKEKNIHFQFTSNKDQFFTIFDMDKLDKIIFNLLSNAFKFTPSEGKITIAITVKKSKNKPTQSHCLEITISDTGIGIAKEYQKAIFDRFFQVNAVDQKPTQGSGIGLTLVNEYVMLYKGKISLESELGKGTTFKVEIPLLELTTQPAMDSENSTDSVELEVLPSILIIDDNRDLLNYLTQNFKEFYNVFISSDGETGWKKILSVRPDLIICDRIMPGMQGMDLCVKVRNDSRTRHIPFILITSNGSEENKLQAYNAGVNDYLIKPFQFDSLHSRVRNLIEQRKSFQQAYSKKIEVPDISDKVKIETEDEKLMGKVLKTITKNLSNSDFSVEKLASDLGVSRSYLYNKTVNLFEKSPLELIIDLRLKRGKELLKKSQLTIAEIAFQTGFNNPKYFTKNFKKNFNILPSEYRNRHNAKTK